MKDLSSNIRQRAVEEKSLKAAFPFMIFSALLAGVSLGVVLVSIPNVLKRDSSSISSAESISIDELGVNQLTEIYGILESTYINDLPLSKEIEYGLIKGLISSLNDPYTNFLTPQEAEIYLDNRQENFEGIGVTLAYNGEYTYIETVLEGLPAFQNGMMSGDIILEVDGEDMTGKIPQLVASKVRGPKGSEVVLKVFRENDLLGESLEFKIIRDTIVVENIMWKDEGGGIVSIDISQFNGESPDAFNDAWDYTVNEIQSEVPNLTGIIIDLRNNPGGYVDSVRHTLEEFLPLEASLMGEATKTKETTTYRDGRVGAFEDVNIVVLVNEGSASASEIFAAAIQENNRGKIIGMSTVGKGVEQIIIDDFSDGSLFIVPFQKWLTPSGRSITKEDPIYPDIKVDYTAEDFQNGADPQFDKALEEVK